MLIICCGIFKCARASCNLGMWIESYALLISRLHIHASLFCSLASSMMLWSMWIGCCVLEPGSPAKLSGERIVCLVYVCTNRLLIIFVKTFLIVSNSVIGLVIFRS